MFCLRWTQKHKISKGGVTPQHNSNRLDGEKICCIPARALYTFAVSKLLSYEPVEDSQTSWRNADYRGINGR